MKTKHTEQNDKLFNEAVAMANMLDMPFSEFRLLISEMYTEEAFKSTCKNASLINKISTISFKLKLQFTEIRDQIVDLNNVMKLYM